MNSTVKKFKKIAENEQKRIGNFLKRECDKLYDSKKMDIFQEATYRFFGKVYVNEDANNEFVETQFDKLCDELKRIHPEEYAYYDDLGFIETCFKKEGFFNNYGILEKLLNKYEFTEAEKLEIYAFFLNISLKHILSYHENHQDRMLKTAEQRANKKLSAKIMKKSVIKREMEKHAEEVKSDQAICRNLRNVIDEEGNIIPFEYATDLIWVFEKQGLEIDMEIAKKILLKSEKDFRILQEQNEQLKQSLEEAEITKQSEREKLAIANSKLELSIKERRTAIHKLKEYLNDDLPIKFISDSELVLIIGLLKTIGYTEFQINNIRKSIVENNISIVNDEQNQKIKRIKTACLSKDNLQIYEIAEEIIGNNESLKNASYDRLLETYNLITGLLVELAENEDEGLKQDDLELLILYIDGLKDDILNYSYSDYRNNNYSLLLKKEQ